MFSLSALAQMEVLVAGTIQIACRRRWRGGGRIEGTAGPELFEEYDRQLQHFRRYTLPGICGVIERAGLVVERRNYLGALIYPGFYLAKKLSQSRPKAASEREQHVASAIGATSRFNAIVYAIMSL